MFFPVEDVEGMKRQRRRHSGTLNVYTKQNQNITNSMGNAQSRRKQVNAFGTVSGAEFGCDNLVIKIDVLIMRMLLNFGNIAMGTCGHLSFRLLVSS